MSASPGDTLPETSPPLPLDVDSVLVVCPSWVSDTVMATPVLRAIHTQRPDARLVAVMRPGLDALLAGNPWLDETIACTMKRSTPPSWV